MINEPEFIRGNQKNYIRISCDTQIAESYEYQMCTNNELSHLLDFQQRTQNGECYLYYEVSGMQSLDILLQTQKLKRPLAIAAAQAIVKLCRDFSEYVLDIQRVIWNPKYIMIQMNSKEFRFVYHFAYTEDKETKQKDIEQTDLEQFLECCIEHLDYQDETLVSQMFHVYEALLDQKDNFILVQEMEALLNNLSPEGNIEKTEIKQMQEDVSVKDPFVKDNSQTEIISIPEKSCVFQKERRHLKIGLGILLLLDIGVLIVWRPLTILKIFFAVAAGGVLLWLNVHIRRQEQQKGKKLQQEQEIYMEEYKELTSQYDGEQGETCMIVMEDSKGVLYNLQNGEPQYIYIGDTRKIIGKDPDKAQIKLEHESVSRVHALIYKEGTVCIVEDLNSTNGTWVNGKSLKPREPYTLKEGDKVRFAGMEYIFR